MGTEAREAKESDRSLRSLGIEIRAFDEDSRSFDVVASTDALDAHNEIVDQSFDLKRFKANPVVLFAHDSRSLPIGKAENIGVRPMPKDASRKALQMRVIIASAEANPLAENVLQSIKEKTLRALSIGFMPGEVKAEEGEDGQTRFRLRKNKLFELSVTPIPSNPETLAQLKAKALEEFQSAKSGDVEETEKRKQDEMDLKEAETKLAKATADLDAANKRADDATARATKAETERDAYKAEAEKAAAVAKTALATAKEFEGVAIDKEIAALVGVKLAPTEVESMTKLRKENPDLFAEIIEARADMPHAKDIVPAISPKAVPPTGTKTNGSGKLSDAVNKGAAA